MLQLPFSRLSCCCVQPTNLLPTGVKITSNEDHRRLLPTDSFGSPNRSILGYRTEPSLLCNQYAGFACGLLGYAWAVYIYDPSRLRANQLNQLTLALSKIDNSCQ